MNTYRKKPVEIEAEQFTGDNGYAIVDWIGNQGGDATCKFISFIGRDQFVVYIETLEGRMSALGGDWIIRGVQGEFYPCKPDIFAATYEPVVSGGSCDPGDAPEETR